VYVGHLSSRTRESDLWDIFSRYGRIRSVDLKRNYGFIEYEDYRDAEDAIYEMDDRDVDGSYILVQQAKGGGRRGPSGPPQRGEYRLVVEGLPRDMSWQDLKDLFRPVCDVAFTDVFTERGRTKGVVEVRRQEDMDRAIRELDDTTVRGSVIYLREEGRRSASPRRSRSRSPRRSRSRSPRKSRSPSPHRSRSRSPRSRSPPRVDGDRRRSDGSRSPIKGSHSPTRDGSVERRSSSPNRKRSRSPSPDGDAKRRRADSPTAEAGQ